MWERLASVVHGVLLTGASGSLPSSICWDLHGVWRVVFLQHVERRVAVWMGAEVFAQHGQGDGGELPAVGTRVPRAFLYCRSFSSVSATPRVVVLF